MSEYGFKLNIIEINHGTQTMSIKTVNNVNCD